MIYVNNQTHDPVNIVITDQHIEQLKVILNRALNCIPPEDPQWKDWFELSDRLEKIV